MRSVVHGSVVAVALSAAALAAGIGSSPSLRQQLCDTGDRITGRSDCLRHARGEKYAVFVARAKDAITRNFKDPATAQWRNVFISHPVGGAPALCGEVNARNGFGAYTGFRSFYFYDDWVEALPKVAENPEDSFFEKMKSISCADKVEEVPDQTARN